VRTMYDSTTVADLPADGDLYLGYVDGRWPTIDALRARFPHQPIVRTTVTGATLDAEVADVESGDLTPASGAGWAKRKIAAGQVPTLYYPASWEPQIIAALRKLGVRPRKVLLFPASYDGKKQLPKGKIAKQYADPKRTGGHFDASVVADYWPGIDPPAATNLTRTSTLLAKQLTSRLARRRKPLRTGRSVLVALRAQLDRVLALKAPQ
jgi:hypothetical protein